MAVVHGKLEKVNGGNVENGTVEIALCGYGSFIPRGGDLYYIARPDGELTVDASGIFTTTLLGNDQIEPAGTYYTVTVKDENGDIVQVNAYRFLGGSDYDLSTLDPYDPNQPPPPLPPLITNLLKILAPADNMIFDGALWLSFKTTLTGPVTAPVFTNMIPGNLYTFIILQDATGHHAFTWPANVKNATPVDGRPNRTTTQTFVADEFQNLLAISAGTYL